MSLLVGRLVIDFGLLVLIWMVQLIIYPGFLFYNKEQLKKWHQVYTKKITIIVAPLMFAQTGIITTQTFLDVNALHLISLVICSLLWVLTFFEAVPLHHKIDKAENLETTCTALVRVNKKRTALWTILFLVAVCEYFWG